MKLKLKSGSPGPQSSSLTPPSRYDRAGNACKPKEQQKRSPSRGRRRRRSTSPNIAASEVAYEKDLGLSGNENNIEEIVRELPIPSASRLDQHVTPDQSQGDCYLFSSPEPDADTELETEQQLEDTGRIEVRHKIPNWFPQKIKDMFLLDRSGGQFSYNELQKITSYRCALERVKRNRWRAYIEAGRARFMLQKLNRRIRRSKLYSPRFRMYRENQYRVAKQEAFGSWKKLERLQLGVRVLDEAIDVNFWQERIIFSKQLVVSGEADRRE